MKPQHLFIWFIVVSSSIAGSALALLSHDRLKLPIDLPAVEGQKAVQPAPQAQPNLSNQPASSYQPIAPDHSLRLAQATPRQPILLQDQIPPGSAFDQFRSQFRQAVRDRNVAFVRGLIPANGVAIGFGVPQSADQLGLENPNSRFWGVLEKAIGQGCAAANRSDYANADANSPVWICPNVTEAFYRQYPNPSTAPGIEYEISRAIVVGDRVNVRAQPSTNSAVVGVLSNEIVQFDQQAWENFPPDQREARLLQPIESWTPVILPSGQRGFVFNRYVYRPLGERLVLGQMSGTWKILYIPAGD